MVSVIRFVVLLPIFCFEDALLSGKGLVILDSSGGFLCLRRDALDSDSRIELEIVGLYERGVEPCCTTGTGKLLGDRLARASNGGVRSGNFG